MRRWLLRRIQGVLLLHHRGQADSDADSDDGESDEEQKREQHILQTTFPLLSELLSPEARVRLDLTGGMSARPASSHVLKETRQQFTSL